MLVTASGRVSSIDSCEVRLKTCFDEPASRTSFFSESEPYWVRGIPSKTMRVLVLSKYGTRAASPRIRFLAYRDALAVRGIHLEFQALLGNDYLDDRFRGRRFPFFLAGRDYLQRAIALIRSRKFDLLWIHCELFPYLPPVFEVLLSRLGVCYVYDFDDAIFHGYDQHPNRLVRALFSSKISKVISGAQAVTAGSEYLARYARRWNPNTRLLPSVVDPSQYHPAKPRSSERIFTVGWIGSPSTAKFLESLRTPLYRLAEESPLRFLVVGARAPDVPGVEVRCRAWSLQREASDLAEMHVGVMPLDDSPWSRGKCAFKLIQYMASSLPTVSSPVGANCDVVTSKTGLFARTSDEWYEALRALRGDAGARWAMGAAGRRRVEEHYSVASHVTALEETLRSAAEGVRGPRLTAKL